jgi:hypothetical protein
MRHFLNNKLEAPNVLEVDVDLAVVTEFSALLNVPLSKVDFHTEKPKWKSDVAWISPCSLSSFKYFHSRFVRLGIANHVTPFLDLKKGVRMYMGFLVTRSTCVSPNFHTDWDETNNEAFTFLTPLTENANSFGLLYKKQDGSIAEYNYSVGKALIFGDRFMHSTKPGKSERPVVLLSFTFGTDKMEHWPAISRTAASQGNLVRLPNGRFIVRDMED